VPAALNPRSVSPDVGIRGGQVDQLDGKVAVITGGAAGIGLALAQELGREGCRVAIADIDEAALSAAEATLRLAGIDVLAIGTDVRALDQVEALAAAVLERFGQVDVVVANAGVIAWNPMEALTIGDWRWVVDVNLWGVVHAVHVFLPILRRQGTPGHVVTVSSVGGVLADTPFMATYSATKGAVIGLTLTLASELRMAGAPIGVTVVCPSATRDTGALDAERNRPAEAGPLAHAPGVDDLIGVIREGIDHGQPRSVLAARVVDAIRHDRLWAFPHPDAQPMLQPRLDDLTTVLAEAGRQPVE
jgi:NAD(P)-dependent dehydrogenase (short-subunit alcohol dehydrogenase family)